VVKASRLIHDSSRGTNKKLLGGGGGAGLCHLLGGGGKALGGGGCGGGGGGGGGGAGGTGVVAQLNSGKKNAFMRACGIRGDNGGKENRGRVGWGSVVVWVYRIEQWGGAKLGAGDHKPTA